ncbi:MAG TPA: hypothetical protein VLM05_00440 [Mycobacteriales bacterium]|nr:hypothetical protein [Mycobacteriales bacterium]
MTVREFPALGFDPAPGDAGALDAAAADVAATGKVFGDASANVSRLNSSGWTGDAADAFRGQLKDLPRDLDLAARSHQTAARALTDYQSGLVSRQRRAAELETRAADLRRREQSAVAEVNRLAGQTAPSGSPEFARLKSQYDSARSTATTLGSDLREVLAQARRLHDEHRSAASTAAGRIRDVADAPYKEPGWLSRAWSSVKGWIADHADALAKISSVLKGISAVLGVLSFVPGLQFLAPFAMGLGVAALVIDGALCLAGKGDWKSFALDVVLTVLPTGPVMRAVKRIPGVTKALKGANALIPASVKGKLFRAVGNLPEDVSPTQLSEAASRIKSEVGELGDDIIVQGSRAGHSAKPTSDVDFGVRVDPDKFDDLVRQRFGNPNPGSAKERTMLHAMETGKIQAGEAGLRGLRRGLEQDLGKEVDLSIIRRGGAFDNEPWLPVQ